jgi:hypothetical protein
LILDADVDDVHIIIFMNCTRTHSGCFIFIAPAQEIYLKTDKNFAKMKMFVVTPLGVERWKNLASAFK